MEQIQAIKKNHFFTVFKGGNKALIHIHYKGPKEEYYHSYSKKHKKFTIDHFNTGIMVSYINKNSEKFSNSRITSKSKNNIKVLR